MRFRRGHNDRYFKTALFVSRKSHASAEAFRTFFHTRQAEPFFKVFRHASSVIRKQKTDFAVAFFTLEILQKMLEEIGMSLPEVIKAYPQCCGETADGNITFDGHSISNIDKMRKKDVIVFRMNCAELKNRYAGTKGVLSGKKISFERAFESKNYRKMIVLAEKIYSLGGRLCSSHDCDLFVCTNAESSQVERAKQSGASLVSLPEFLSLTGMTEEELSAAAEKTDIKALKQKADLL